ncbi:MAG: hypothetical protein ACI379_10785, partial [Nocardioides sp.]|uniref:hypothetical protein n=1 Tax=Nocardioides sp. TaxID=35761 RepID=UPI003F0F8D18
MQTYPGAPAPASTDRSKTLLWIGLGLIVGGVLVQLAFNFILSLGDFRLYRAVGWLNFITVLTPIGTVIAVIGGAGVGTRMALREAGLLP